MTQTTDDIREIQILTTQAITNLENGCYTAAQQKITRITKLRDELFG